MEIITQKYVRKPLFVDAVEVTAENFKDLAAWCQGEIQTDGTQEYIRVRVHTPKSARQTQAFVGDWILYTDRGYKVYSNKAFGENFKPTEGTSTPAVEVSLEVTGSGSFDEPNFSTPGEMGP